MEGTTELRITINLDRAETISFYLSLSQIMDLVSMSAEAGLDYLAGQAGRANPAARSLKEVLYARQTVIEMRLGNFTKTLTGHPELSLEIVQIYLAALHQAFELRQTELDIVMAIDAIRDTCPEPAAMLAAIVSLLAERLEADFCLLYVLEQKTGKMTLAASKERN